jgi:hypothetical protein
MSALDTAQQMLKATTAFGRPEHDKDRLFQRTQVLALVSIAESLAKLAELEDFKANGPRG